MNIRKSTANPTAGQPLRDRAHRHAARPRKTAKDFGGRSVRARLALTGAACATALLLPPAAITVASAQSAAPQTLRLYSNTVLKPRNPIPLPALPNLDNPWSTRIPTVVVKVSSAVEMATPASPPPSVFAPVPANVANRLAAYLFPVNQWDWMYVIGPRGLKGTAELAADGSDAIVLKNKHAFIELDTPGGSPIAAFAMAEQFHPAAGKALAHAGLGITYSQSDSLRHSTVQYEYRHRLALFAFASQGGQSVYGYNLYDPSGQAMEVNPFGRSAQFVYASDRTDANLAKWVVQSGLSALTHIGAPDLSGAPIKTATVSVSAGNRAYTLQAPEGFSSYGMATLTGSGVAWLQQPTWVDTGSGMRADIPSGPFFIELSPPNSRTLTVASPTRQLVSIPPYKLPDASNVPWYTSVDLLRTAGPHWLLYTTTYAGVGMNQPAGNDLYAIDVGSASSRPVHITSFVYAGGMFFSVGVYGSYVVYDQSGITGAKGGFSHHIWLVDLNTGKRRHLPTSALKGSTVSVTIHGKRVNVLLSGE